MVVPPVRAAVVAAPLAELPVSPGKPCFCSIVIPVYQDSAALYALLTDLQPIRCSGYEVIVVEATSSYCVDEPLRDLCDQYLFSAKGRALQMNHGAKAAQGQILWFLHADTRLDAELCHRQILQTLFSDDQWGRFNVRLSGAAKPLRWVERMMNWRSCMTAIATGDQGIFVKRTAFDGVGGYASQPLMEDIELSKQLKKQSRPFCSQVSIQTSSRRWEERGLMKTVLLMWWLRLAYWMGIQPQTLAGWYR